jgi:ActR/RegA family two-component response regulator/GGDEF domain-containing protein
MNDHGVETSSLNVLLASGEHGLVDMASRAMMAEGDRVTVAMSVSEAIATAQVERYDLAFVDVTLDGDAGLALVHHLAVVSPGVSVRVLAPPAKINLATEAISLGAAGMHVSPVSGDELVQSANETRARLLEGRVRAALEHELDRMRRRSDLLDRLIRLARGSGQSEAMRVITDAFQQASDARGVALYATFDGPNAECVRLATTGTARDMPAMAKLDELAKTFALRKARPLSLSGSQGRLGIVALEGSQVDVEHEYPMLVELAMVVLALIDSRRPRGSMNDEREGIYTKEYFQDTAQREIEKAKRHGRRLSIACLSLDGTDRLPRQELEATVRQVVRDTDLFATTTPTEYLLLLPETGTLGAHACRRRILARADGDRRARTQNVAADRRGPVPTRRASPLSIGVASFPHDGGALDRLLRVARARAVSQARSAVHALSLGALALDAVVDSLLAKPILDAGSSSPFPLDLATPALLSLVAQVCREARRGGAASVFVSVQPGFGVASAVRQTMRDAKDVTVKAVDARGVSGCADLEAVVVLAEHGSWVCCGRLSKERFRGVHAADPLLADLVAHRLAQAGGLRGP